MELSSRILTLVKLSYLCQAVKHIQVLYHFVNLDLLIFSGAPRAEIEVHFGICQCINTRVTRIIMLELSLCVSWVGVR
jgi:hypothetical protein